MEKKKVKTEGRLAYESSSDSDITVIEPTPSNSRVSLIQEDKRASLLVVDQLITHVEQPTTSVAAILKYKKCVMMNHLVI